MDSALTFAIHLMPARNQPARLFHHWTVLAHPAFAALTAEFHTAGPADFTKLTIGPIGTLIRGSCVGSGVVAGSFAVEDSSAPSDLPPASRVPDGP